MQLDTIIPLKSLRKEWKDLIWSIHVDNMETEVYLCTDVIVAFARDINGEYPEEPRPLSEWRPVAEFRLFANGWQPTAVYMHGTFDQWDTLTHEYTPNGVLLHTTARDRNGNIVWVDRPEEPHHDMGLVTEAME